MRSYFSASQVSVFDLCPRKWAFGYLDGLKSPSKPAQATGVETHAELEEWLRDGKPLNLMTDAGQIAMSGLHYLPVPKAPGLEVETEFWLEIGGHTFKGFKDWQILGPTTPVVGDHKTTSDFKWMKSADDLRGDFQAAIYAADAMFRTDAVECDLQWTYFRTRGARQAKVVHLTVTRDDVAPVLERMIGLCDQMAAYRDGGARAVDVTPNTSACRAFGGCEYLQLCNPTPQERWKATMTQATAGGFLGNLEARNGGAINPPPMQMQGPPPAPPGWRYGADGQLQQIPPEPPPGWQYGANGQLQQIPPAGWMYGADGQLQQIPAPVQEPPPAAAAAPAKRTRAAKAAPAESEEVAEDRRVHAATLLDQAAALIKTCAQLVREL